MYLEWKNGLENLENLECTWNWVSLIPKIFFREVFILNFSYVKMECYCPSICLFSWFKSGHPSPNDLFFSNNDSSSVLIYTLYPFGNDFRLRFLLNIELSDNVQLFNYWLILLYNISQTYHISQHITATTTTTITTTTTTYQRNGTKGCCAN